MQSVPFLFAFYRPSLSFRYCNCVQNETLQINKNSLVLYMFVAAGLLSASNRPLLRFHYCACVQNKTLQIVIVFEIKSHTPQ